jgi:hypothetical protein
MDYNTMIDSIGETRKRWSNSNKTGPTYEELLLKGNGYWQNLNRLTQTQLEIDIIDKFLNSPKWLCHLALPKDGPKRIPMLQNLMACLQNTPKYYSALNAYKLENVNFADLIAIDGHQIPIIFAIDDLYTMFLKVGNTFSRVAASKLMNLASKVNLYLFSHRSFEQVIEFLCGSFLKSRHNVAISIQRHRYSAVSQSLLNNLRVYSLS